MKVTIILGTRPQIIKSAPVYSAFRKNGVECDIVNTGQHYDYQMNREFFEELRLPDPSADLDIGRGSPSQQVSAIVGGLGPLLAERKPHLAVVPGDTNSALAAGIACSKSGISVAHLEAGCRSGDARMAEEINRRVLDHISELLLCPTPGCVRNAKSEHVIASAVENVGDTMYDSLLALMPRIESARQAARLGLPEAGYAFMTLHRAETVDDAQSLREVMAAASSLPLAVAFAVHPRTRERMAEFGIAPGRNVRMLEPLPYIDTLSLVRSSKVVVTDSGGLQKEAYWLGKPTLIARDVTEWTEIVRAGAAFLVGTKTRRFEAGYAKATRLRRGTFAGAKRIFGDGHASEKVAGAVARFMNTGRSRK